MHTALTNTILSIKTPHKCLFSRVYKFFAPIFFGVWNSESHFLGLQIKAKYAHPHQNVTPPPRIPEAPLIFLLKYS